ncbi:MAG: hypothetical protein H0X65_14425 [Gemmatimonadetes bacterium]|nr:hypothetical protein [Gemmatimonadota bacterium]
MASVVEHRPASCGHCLTPLAGGAAVGEPVRWQVCELPPVRSQVTEHLLSVNETCRQQDRSMLGYLTDAITPHRAGQPAPLLVAH